MVEIINHKIKKIIELRLILYNIYFKTNIGNIDII